MIINRRNFLKSIFLNRKYQQGLFGLGLFVTKPNFLKKRQTTGNIIIQEKRAGSMIELFKEKMEKCLVEDEVKFDNIMFDLGL